MSNHKTPVTELERAGLVAHGLGRQIGKPSQLADVFRQGVAWALSQQPAQQPLSDAEQRELVKECGLDWEKGSIPLFAGDTTNRYAVLIEAVERKHSIKEKP
jgi:hypothetical protein